MICNTTGVQSIIIINRKQLDYIAWCQLSVCVCVCLGICTYPVYRHTVIFGAALPVLHVLEALRYTGIPSATFSLSARQNTLTTQS